jgi:tetratricopeptide (TPR) repeat protein
MRNMETRTRVVITLYMLVAGLWFVGLARAQQLGSITFPTSGAPAAQPAFLEGVKDLHSFQFDEAALAFQKAEAADPGFALAYWGEAMSHNHPLWSEVDVPAAKGALEKLAPTPEGRVAKAKAPKERAYLEAVNQLFYTPGDKLARDNAYSQAMAKMYEQWPDDHEVDIFYALSLLGTVRPSDTGFRRQALAASICLKVFQENPNHPGAAHFIIHAFDDPDHAILALPAARAYAKIAPSAAHAVHMPTHIFLRLGMWQDVASSNIVAYQSAVALNQHMHLAEGREDFHALSWLEYANLMLGKFDEAKKNLELAKASDDRNPGSRPVHQGYLGMRARYILETGQWEKIPVEAAAAGPTGEGIDYARGADNGTWTFIAGLSAIKLGDLSTADKAAAQLRAMRERTEASGNSYAAKPFAIMEKELVAETQLARGQKDDAVRLAKEAADIDLTVAPPSGPPEPIKPALELYGDVLMEAGHAKEAVAAYEQELLRTPNRTPTVKGLARAKGAQVSMTTSVQP